MAREMKDSGIEWIGEIPESWTHGKAKYYIDISNGSDPKTEGEIPVYGSGAGSFRTCGEYKEGPCVLLGRKGATLHIPHYIDHDYWNVDTAFDVKTKANYNLRFYFYLACCFDYKQYISQTTLPGMTQTSYENMVIPVPTPQEQELIVVWLDSKTKQIDETINQTRASIEEYKKLKQAVITQAVTKGIRPDRQMKDSGVEWIGDIPADWGIIRCKYISSFINGFAFDSQDFMTNYVFPVIRIGDIRDGKINTENCVGINNNTGLDKYLIHENDILLAMSGATVGKVGIACNIGKAYINQRVGIIRTICSKFLFYCLSTGSFVEYIILCASGSAQPNVSGEVYGEYYIPFPAISIQQEIVSYLDQKTSMIEMLIAKKENLLSSLESYKKSLIYEYVTGKKEVPA